MKTTRHDSFAAYVLPSVLAFALSGLYTIVDGFFIGQSLGDLGLAAITLAYPAAALLQAVGTGIGLAGAIRCTILQARGEEQTPRTCFSGTVLLLLATSAAFAAVLLGLLGPVLTVLGAQDEARPLAAEYIRVIACGTAFQILATGLVPFIRNLGGSAFAMVAMGTGFVTNIALDYLFVWEFHWGMAGGAWATVIGQAATMLLAIGYLVRRRVGFVPPKAGEVLPLWGALLKVAAAPVGLTFSPNITLMVMNHFLLRYGGALAIAVYGCIDYVLSTIYMLLQGVGDGSQPLISRAYGAGDFGELRRTGGARLPRGLRHHGGVHCCAFSHAQRHRRALRRVCGGERRRHCPAAAVSGDAAAAGIHARDDRIFLRDGKDRAVIRARVFRAGADVRRAAHSAAAAQAHRRVAGDPGGTGAHVLHRRARAAAHAARARASGVSRKRQSCLYKQQRPLHSQWALPAYQKPRRVSPPERRKKVRSFSQATCAAGKILLGLQTCAPSAFGGRRVALQSGRKPFVKK
ncbi:MAG: MATE family efflux transporter [Oscillospiraceae bacterium]